MDLTVQDIKELMEALHRNKISELKIKKGDFSLELEGIKEAPVYQAAASAPVFVEQSATPGESAVPAAPEYRGNVVKSPIVGTFYAAPAPDKDPYVKVGSKVKKGDVLFIIESMKLMNEVTSELDGTVAEILVNNAQGVEYGQPILCIE